MSILLNIMKFELYTALHYIKSRKDNSFVSRLLVISILTVTLAITVPIIVLSVINGFHSSIKDKIIASNFQLRIKHKYDNFDSYEHLLNELNKNPDVKLAVPFFEKLGLIRLDDGKPTYVLVKSFKNKDILKNKIFLNNFKIITSKESTNNLNDKSADWNSDININKKKSPHKLLFKQTIKQTNKPNIHNEKEKKDIPFQINELDDIIIGDALIPETLTRENIDFYVGNEVKILIPHGDSRDIKPENIKTLKISNFYSAEYAKFNKMLVFIHFDAISKYFGFKQSPTDIGIYLKQDASVKNFIFNIKNKYPDLYVINTSEEGLFKDFAQQKKLMIILLLFLVASAFVTIYIAVHVAVIDKRKDIGLLKTIGSKRRNIQLIFIFEGLFISFIGVTFGNLLGILITSSLTQIVDVVEKIVNSARLFACQHNLGKIFNITCPENLPIPDSWYWHIMNRKVFYLKTFPYEINYSDIIILCIGAIFVSIFAAYFPSKRASE
ncbi:MAG: FtsX-like permease family protein, partial [Spirochaetota bacterium]|nr:FtsX-like permease family protein [Spirochaetota bacterium]